MFEIKMLKQQGIASGMKQILGLNEFLSE